MLTATNDITGDRLISKRNSDKFLDNFDRIFGKKEAPLGESKKPKDRVKLGVSPSTKVEEWDCRGEVEKITELSMNHNT